ncbi:hypothetical protein GCM10025872_05900 [Barrientosiimonas endolithica]|uniref:50S ribosomal protein L10 n=1 Tax=Barrientosiimonas endolithica TaxID=1535208 RepID=A0ABM8H7U9_9MICO|nr:hypothetical protein GCM10025872_05900 [Barrientosiimonas endolithica]
MPNAQKDAAIADLAEKFRTSTAAVLTEYRGLSVAQLTKLRTDLREHATYSVVKNTLTQRAAQEAGVTAFDGQLEGPTAIAFITGDPVEAAKGLRDFAKENPFSSSRAVCWTATRSPATRSTSSRTSSRARPCSPSWPAP